MIEFTDSTFATAYARYKRNLDIARYNPHVTPA